MTDKQVIVTVLAYSHAIGMGWPIPTVLSDKQVIITVLTEWQALS